MQHRVNDTAMLDATVAELARSGWSAVKTSEREVEQGRVPVAGLDPKMGPGALAAAQLMPPGSGRAGVGKRPSSALHRPPYRPPKPAGGGTPAVPRPPH